MSQESAYIQIRLNENETTNLTEILEKGIPANAIPGHRPDAALAKDETLLITILRRVETTYSLNLIDSDFIHKFAFHIENLHQRLRSGIIIKAPSHENINQNYPLIYDIAVFIAQELEREWKLKVNPNEVDYIVFHIGSFLATSRQNEMRVNVLLYYKRYYDYNNDLKDKIDTMLGDLIHIIDVRRFDSDEPVDPTIDMIISTSPDYSFYQNFSVPVYVMSPIISGETIERLRRFANNLKRNRQAVLLKDYLLQVLRPELFKHNVAFSSPEDAITQMGNEVQKMGLVPDQFVNEVLQRETSSSTAFYNQLAIPHAINQIANHTFFSIVINDEALVWGKQSVHIICMFGLRADERKEFRLLFEQIINVFSRPENVSALKQASDFTTFISVLAELIESKQW